MGRVFDAFDKGSLSIIALWPGGNLCVVRDHAVLNEVRYKDSLLTSSGQKKELREKNADFLCVVFILFFKIQASVNVVWRLQMFYNSVFSFKGANILEINHNLVKKRNKTELC